jgi:hypothetical protein
VSSPVCRQDRRADIDISLLHSFKKRIVLPDGYQAFQSFQ